MTVQNLIDELNKIKDKNQTIDIVDNTGNTTVVWTDVNLGQRNNKTYYLLLNNPYFKPKLEI